MTRFLLSLAILMTLATTVLPGNALARGHYGSYRSGGGHRTATYRAPTYRAPTYHAPRVHTYHAPGYHAPKYHAPKYHAPKYHAPKVHTAKAPKTHWYVPHAGGHRAHNDSPYKQYRREVDRLSNENYRRNRRQIDPGHMRGKRGHMDLDHRTPVKQCFDRGIPASQCADSSNLRMLDAHQNRSEGCRGCKKGK